MTLKSYAEYAYDTQKRQAVSGMLQNPNSPEEKDKFLKDPNNIKLFSLDDAVFVDQIQKAFTEFRVAYSDRVKEDLITACVVYGIAPEEYFQFEFLSQNHEGRTHWLGDKERFVLFHSFYDYSKYERVRDKWQQYQVLKDYFGRDCINLERAYDDGEKAFDRFIQKHKEFIFKPTRLSCGRGVRIISADSYDKELYQLLCTDGGIADEKIDQDERLGSFHPESVNTVRLIAFRGEDCRNHYGQALFRMGKGNGIIDNSSEAIRAMLDAKTGVVFSEGSDSYGNRYIFHPDTGVKIVGFEIPEWKKLIDIADDVMYRISDYARFIGFDFALSTEGWKIVEINPYPQIVTQQVIKRRGCKSDMLRILRECTSTNIYDKDVLYNGKKTG